MEKEKPIAPRKIKKHYIRKFRQFARGLGVLDSRNRIVASSGKMDAKFKRRDPRRRRQHRF